MSEIREIVNGLAQGNGQILSVMGEPGLGKSRLVAELRKNLITEGVVRTPDWIPMVGSHGASGIAIEWCEGRSLSYQTNTPFAPFIDLFTNCFGIGDEQSDDARYDLIRSQVAQHLPGREGEIAPLLATMMEIEVTRQAAEGVRYLEPPQVRTGIFSAVQGFVEALASSRPVVLVCEDLHWVDPTSLELIEQLLPLTDRASLMVVGNFRPWRQESSWSFHELASRDYSHRYQSITLAPLSEDDSRELVANLLEVEDLPERVRNLILEKA